MFRIYRYTPISINDNSDGGCSVVLEIAENSLILKISRKDDEDIVWAVADTKSDINPKKITFDMYGFVAGDLNSNADMLITSDLRERKFTSTGYFNTLITKNSCWQRDLHPDSENNIIAYIKDSTGDDVIGKVFIVDTFDVLRDKDDVLFNLNDLKYINTITMGCAVEWHMFEVINSH